MVKRKRRLYSERLELVEKSREAALSAVQIYNNPTTTFKTESFLVLFVIAWVYLLHAHYRKKRIEYRYYKVVNGRKKYDKIDGAYKYWDLSKCFSIAECPLDSHTVNNLKFLIGLRNQIEHKKAVGLDSYFSARYQACALNYNYYLKKLHGNKYGLDKKLALSLQFAELNYDQSQVLRDREDLIAKHIRTYIADFDNGLTEEEIKNERFAYRLLFTKVSAKRKGQADRVIEFLSSDDPLAKSIEKEFWVKEDREKPKFSATQVIKEIQKRGIANFKMYQHTLFWREHDGKNPSKGFGSKVVETWYWYQNWIDFIYEKLSKGEFTI
ncbi:MAG: DUF3644 domain-containing protein [Candidatus Omnitrophica bacterium]|nr:DUF3644 domain-containing protein [Candidatus Omnitrophota bacterium]